MNVEQRHLERAQELIYDKLLNHLDPGVRTIAALGPPPLDSDHVRRVAEHLANPSSRAMMDSETSKDRNGREE